MILIVVLIWAPLLNRRWRRRLLVPARCVMMIGATALPTVLLVLSCLVLWTRIQWSLMMFSCSSLIVVVICRVMLLLALRCRISQKYRLRLLLILLRRLPKRIILVIVLVVWRLLLLLVKITALLIRVREISSLVSIILILVLCETVRTASRRHWHVWVNISTCWLLLVNWTRMSLIDRSRFSPARCIFIIHFKFVSQISNYLAVKLK